MRVYISGGMTGWPDNNREAFDEARDRLLAWGHDVTSPVDLDLADGEDLSGDGFTTTDEEYEGFLERDLALISRDNLDAIVFIRGWPTSGGAGREGRKAIEEGLDLFVFNSSIGALIRLTPKQFLSRSRTERLRPTETRVP